LTHVKEATDRSAHNTLAKFEKVRKIMTHTLKAILMSSALVLGAGSAMAQSQGDWSFGVGIGNVDPKSDNGELASLDASIDDDFSFIFTAEYFIRDNLGIELLAATPFEHDITLDGSVDAGSTKHLPPTLSLNYHFPTGTAWKPYVGAGINYTTFFSEDSDLGKLELDDSWGFAVQAGIDYAVNANSALRFTARWIDIDTDVELDGTDIGTAEIDPVVLSVSYVFNF
jgi:outer membrane protein